MFLKQVCFGIARTMGSQECWSKEMLGMQKGIRCYEDLRKIVHGLQPLVWI